jgi:hypothetical protein
MFRFSSLLKKSPKRKRRRRLLRVPERGNLKRFRIHRKR